MRALVRLAAACLTFAATACIENPGVDQQLAMAQEKQSLTVDIDQNLEVKLRLFRENGITRMYLSNTGSFALDSLTCLVQIATTYPRETYWEGGSPIAYPYFAPIGLAERYLLVRGLTAGKEIDLGAVAPGYKGKVSDLYLHLIPLGYGSGSRVQPIKRAGFYRGRVVRTGLSSGDGNDSGSVRGILNQRNRFFLWSSVDGLDMNLRGNLEADKIKSLTFGNFTYSADRAQKQFDARDSSGTLILAVGQPAASGRDSVRAVFTAVEPETISAH